jgi:hypothetical protein
MTGVTEATMPNIMRGGGCGESTGVPGVGNNKAPPYYCIKEVHAEKKVPHRKTKRIKIDGTIIISSELTNRDKIFNNAGCNKNITKMKRRVR